MATILDILPTDDGATSLNKIETNFNNLNTDKAEITYVDNEINGIDSAKLDKGGLRVALSNLWSMFFSNGTGSETAVALGTSGKVLTSNGVDQAPTFEAPTVSITGLTEDTTGDMTADYIVKNNGTGLNTKIKVNKYMASDAEALAGTVENKFLNPKQVKDNYQSVLKQYIIVADTNILYSNLTQVGTATIDISWQDRKSFTSNSYGTINISAALNTLGLLAFDAGQNKLRFIQVRGGATIYTSSEFVGDTTLKTCSVGPLAINAGDIIKVQGWWNNSYAQGKIQDFYGKGTLTGVNPLV